VVKGLSFSHVVKVGVVRKKLSGNKILVAMEKELSLNEKVYDSSGKPIGIVKDIIGKVNSPLAVVLLLVPPDQVALEATVFRKRDKK
jgi:rRNA processing protein Gar1